MAVCPRHSLIYDVTALLFELLHRYMRSRLRVLARLEYSILKLTAHRHNLLKEFIHTFLIKIILYKCTECLKLLILPALVIDCLVVGNLILGDILAYLHPLLHKLHYLLINYIEFAS